MTDQRTSLITLIHDASQRFVLAITGGGSMAISDLLAVPGATRTMLEATVPYSAAAVQDLLGVKPAQFCSESTARALAVTCYCRALQLKGHETPDSPGYPVVGLGCTASLASDRTKRGPHRAYVAVQTAGCTDTVSLELSKGHRDRDGEERLVSDLVLNRIAAACQLSPLLTLELAGSETPAHERFEAPDQWRQLLSGNRDKVAVGTELAAQSAPVILPGAFNPLHAGHREMARLAEERLQQPVCWEISIRNVAKPPLDYIAMRDRVGQFSHDQTVWLTSAPTFVQKAALFPGATFVVGADTILRIADPRYYGNSELACRQAIRTITELGCRFLVFGRLLKESFVAVEQTPLPDELLALCTGVSEDEFRRDISSTELRTQAAAARDELNAAD